MMIVIHFMISEQEPMLRLIIVYGEHSSTNRIMVSVLILILFGDLLIPNIKRFYLILQGHSTMLLISMVLLFVSLVF